MHRSRHFMPFFSLPFPWEDELVFGVGCGFPVQGGLDMWFVREYEYVVNAPG